MMQDPASILQKHLAAVLLAALCILLPRPGTHGGIEASASLLLHGTQTVCTDTDSVQTIQTGIIYLQDDEARVAEAVEHCAQYEAVVCGDAVVLDFFLPLPHHRRHALQVVQIRDLHMQAIRQIRQYQSAKKLKLEPKKTWGKQSGQIEGIFKLKSVNGKCLLQLPVQGLL